MIKQRTMVAACVLSALDFFHYSCFTTFFPSYLQVAAQVSVQAAVERADVAVATGVFFAAMNLGAAAGTR